MKEKVVLAFSGGLDTSFCALYLSKEKNLEVHAVTVNTGGFDAAAIAVLEQRAHALGVASFTCIDATNDFYSTCVKFLIAGNVLKNHGYPLSVSAERVTQGLIIAEQVKKIGAQHVAHGSTGAGNDQVRFDMFFHVLLPDVNIITPVRDLQLSREATIAWLSQHGVDMDAKKAAYSINKGLWGTSVGGKETLSSDLFLPEEAFPTSRTKETPEQHVLHFQRGELYGIDDQQFNHPVAAIEALQEIAGAFGIGRSIHTGDTIIGIKGRVGFEAAAPLIIIEAHRTLEKHVLTKWQLHWKDQLGAWYGSWLHEGQYLDPVMRDIERFLESTQQNVTGEVIVTLLPFRFRINGIRSPHDLMRSEFGSYGEMNRSWTGEDVRGFSKIFSNPVKIYHQVNSTTIAE